MTLCALSEFHSVSCRLLESRTDCGIAGVLVNNTTLVWSFPYFENQVDRVVYGVRVRRSKEGCNLINAVPARRRVTTVGSTRSPQPQHHFLTGYWEFEVETEVQGPRVFPLTSMSAT